jgi:hypothetical protein
METSRPLLIFFGVFAAAFALVYIFAMEWNLAAITYHPRPMEFDIGATPSRDGPAMYWYGWMITAACGGLIAGLVAMLVLARQVSASVWLTLGWLAPAIAMAASIYFTLPFFTR